MNAPGAEQARTPPRARSAVQRRSAAQPGSGRRSGPASVALVIEARFPGGTSSAVARELAALCALSDRGRLGRPRVVAVSSAMFRGRDAAPVLQEACAALGLALEWDPPNVGADLVVVHNPAFLKFQDSLALRIVARRLVVVTHENFTRPGGAESFDVARCLGAIGRASVALERLLAPVSPLNRRSVETWCGAHPETAAPWSLMPRDWFNICDFDLRAPSPAPRDRRGRLSRPGHEKFPPLAALEACFPPHAEKNLILGGDTLIGLAADHPHWDIRRFRAIEVDEFFEQIDFLVHFTAPTWRESFGRVLAEAIAAGKLVITDAQTARNFPDGAVAARADEVDALIAGFLAAPAEYGARVRAGQAGLARYSQAAFCRFFEATALPRGPGQPSAAPPGDAPPGDAAPSSGPVQPVPVQERAR